MLYSRAGDYPPGQPLLYAESFSPNTPQGACPTCHGLGRVYEVTEKSLVPDDSLTIRERAIAAWPTAWGARTCATSSSRWGSTWIDRGASLPQDQREWILFTDEQPVVPVYAGLTPAETRRARKHKEEPATRGPSPAPAARLHLVREHREPEDESGRCTSCSTTRARCATASGCVRNPLSVTFAGLDLPTCRGSPWRNSPGPSGPTLTAPRLVWRRLRPSIPSRRWSSSRITGDLRARLSTLLQLGLKLSQPRGAARPPSPRGVAASAAGDPGRSNLFGVVYVLDEPSAGCTQPTPKLC
jgi:excinuclease ABC subunit A